MEQRTAGEGGWTGVILAGGRSSRMGRDKALVPLHGRPLLQRALDIMAPHVDELLVIGDPVKYGHVSARVIADDVPGVGPLGGIVTALRNARHARMLVLACDMPHITPRLLRVLKEGMCGERTAFVPACDGRMEPLSAAYHRRCLPGFEDRVHNGHLKMADALEAAGATFMQVCPGGDGWPADLFRNINAPADL